MKLATKLTLALILGIVIVMSVYAWVQVRQEVVLSDADLNRARRMGLAWMGTMEAVWEQDGEARARALIARANARTFDMRLRLVGLEDEADVGSMGLSPADLAAVRAGQLVRVERTGDDGEDRRYIYAALTVHGTHPAAVELVEPVWEQHTYIRWSHVGIFAAALAVVLVCGAIASMLQFRLVGRPLQLVRDKARRAGTGDFTGPLAIPQHDEIGELAADINLMCDRLAEAGRRVAAETEARITALEQLRHTDRLATVGQLAAGVAHELGTPLGVVSARAELLVPGNLPPADVGKNARIIVEQTDRMTDIIRQLLDFSRRRQSKPVLASLDRAVTRAVDLLSGVAQRARVTVLVEHAPGPLLAFIDETQLQQALTNVILNGIQAMPDGGRLTVSVGLHRTHPPGAHDGHDADYACVSIDDEGTGIPREALGRIFEPFYTTKGVGEGTGLGLAVAHGIVAEHGGWIEVASEPGHGSRFSIVLPHPAEAREEAS